MERALRESREMAELEALQRKQDAEDELERERESKALEAEQVGQQRQRKDGQVELQKAMADHTRMRLKDDAEEKAKADRAQLQRQQDAEDERLRLEKEAQAEAQAKTKADAKAAKAEVKAKAKAEKANIKVEAEANANTSPNRNQSSPVSETHVPPPSSQSRKGKGKVVAPSFNTAPSPSQKCSGSESPVQSPSSNLSPPGSHDSHRKETRILSPSSNPAPSGSQNDADEERQEPPASTPIPTASQSKKAKVRAAKKNKKSTVLETSSTHSRDGQAQSNVTNPMVAPSLASLRNKAAEPSWLFSVQPVDSSQRSKRAESPAKKQSPRPRDGSLLPMYTGQVLPIEHHRKQSRDNIEWHEGYEAEFARRKANGEDEPMRMSQEEGYYDEGAEQHEEYEEVLRKRRETAEQEERQHQQDAEDEAERGRLEAKDIEQEHRRIEEQKEVRPQQHAEEERLRFEAEAETQAKAESKADNLRANAEREELQRQQGEEERESMQVEWAEAKAMSEEDERQRQHEEDEERLRLEAEAEAQAEAEANAVQSHNAELVRQAAAKSNARLLREDSHDAPESTESTEDGMPSDAFAREVSPEPASHGYVSEQFMQTNLTGPTTMNKLQQSGSSYSTSSPYSSAPWSTTSAPAPAPSQDYDSCFDNAIWDSPVEPATQRDEKDSPESTELPEPQPIRESSLESTEFWQGIPDTPAHSTSDTPAVPQKRSIDAIQYNNPASTAASPFRPPMNSDAYKVPEPPTSSQKRRRVDMGWQPTDPIRPPNPWTADRIPEKAPRNTPVKTGVPSTAGYVPHSFSNLSSKSRRIEENKALARMRQAEYQRQQKEIELDQHMAIRLRQQRLYDEAQRNVDKRIEMRYNLLYGFNGYTPEQAIRHVDGVRQLDEPKKWTAEELHKLHNGLAADDGQKKDAQYLYAFRESVLDSNTPAASLYLAMMLKVGTEPRRICEVLCATAARCVPSNPYGDKPFIGNPMANHYMAMASHVMNVAAFADGSDELLQEQLLATTVQLAQASKTRKWKKGLKELFEALEGDDKKELRVPKCLQKGTDEDRERRRYMGQAAMDDNTYGADDPRQLVLDSKFREYLPSTLSHLDNFMTEPLEEAGEEWDTED